MVIRMSPPAVKRTTINPDRSGKRLIRSIQCYDMLYTILSFTFHVAFLLCPLSDKERGEIHFKFCLD